MPVVRVSWLSWVQALKMTQPLTRQLYGNIAIERGVITIGADSDPSCREVHQLRGLDQVTMGHP